jgi:hypothetical protein
VLHLTAGFLDERIIEQVVYLQSPYHAIYGRQVRYWDGPVSLTVVISNDGEETGNETRHSLDELLLATRQYVRGGRIDISQTHSFTLFQLTTLRSCHKHLEKKLSVHLLYRKPPNETFACPPIVEHSMAPLSSCDRLPRMLRTAPNVNYPVNAARNVARRVIHFTLVSYPFSYSIPDRSTSLSGTTSSCSP